MNYRLFSYLRNVDWKLLLFALFACYLLPILLIGTIVAGMGRPGQPLPQIPGMAMIVCLMTVPPVAAGYFVFNYAKQLPQLQALLVALIGFTPYWFARNSLVATMGFFAYSLVCVALGAFICTRRARARRDG